MAAATVAAAIGGIAVLGAATSTPLTLFPPQGVPQPGGGGAGGGGSGGGGGASPAVALAVR